MAHVRLFSGLTRSQLMSRIRGSGNKRTELRLIQIFKASGIKGWRRGRTLSLKFQGTRAKAPASKSSGLFLPPPNLGTRVSHPALRSGPNLRLDHLRAAALRQVSGLKVVRSAGRVRPDFVFPKLRVALFVDGCFWHGCPKHATWPKTRAAFWRAKIEGNRARDRRVNRALRGRGWTVVRVWEHELAKKNPHRLLRRLQPVT